jgi:hypothetical protein
LHSDEFKYDDLWSDQININQDNSLLSHTIILWKKLVTRSSSVGLYQSFFLITIFATMRFFKKTPGFFPLLWDWGLGPFQLGKIATKQEIWEISFYIIYSGSNQIKSQCFFS